MARLKPCPFEGHLEQKQIPYGNDKPNDNDNDRCGSGLESKDGE